MKVFCLRCELEHIILLNHIISDYDKLILLLKSEYGYSLTKKQLSEVLGISVQTIDRRIIECANIPLYIRSSEGKKATYFWPITSVARYILDTVKIF